MIFFQILKEKKNCFGSITKRDYIKDSDKGEERIKNKSRKFYKLSYSKNDSKEENIFAFGLRRN